MKSKLCDSRCMTRMVWGPNFQWKTQETKNTHCELIMLKEPLRTKQERKRTITTLLAFGYEKTSRY